MASGEERIPSGSEVGEDKADEDDGEEEELLFPAPTQEADEAAFSAARLEKLVGGSSRTALSPTYK